ncbi:MAG: PHP domain-containing protein [Anaerosomatales bacterium]|nr:PHP domain-containing protein [Anaerosomatales bacterium]
MAIDLHIHSTASDGTLAPAALVAMARDAGLRAIAVADHDSVAGVAEALAAGRDAGVIVVPAVELSAGLDARGLHVLGYWIDHTDAALLDTLERLRAERLQRAERMVAELARGGYGITIDDVLARAGGGSVGRAHIAMALVDAGRVESVAAAFGDLIGRGKPYYVPKPVASFAEVIGYIHAAAGLAVLAHPGVTKADDAIDALVDAGLDGLEALHAEHDDGDRERYAALAAARGLIVTGGSDFHGPGQAGGRIGAGDVPDDVLETLVARGGERARRMLG